MNEPIILDGYIHIHDDPEALKTLKKAITQKDIYVIDTKALLQCDTLREALKHFQHGGKIAYFYIQISSMEFCFRNLFCYFRCRVQSILVL